jgi:acetyl-CoA carboxylase carboxyltransferase component
MEALKVSNSKSKTSTPVHKANSMIVNHRADLKKAGDKRDELYARLEAEYMNLQNPVRTANKFGVEEIIDPAKTRTLLCRWTKYM